VVDTDFSLGLNVTNYLNSGRQATQVTQQLQGAVANLTQGSVLAQAALNRLIPLSAFAGVGKFAAVSAQAQKELQGLKATAVVAGQSLNGLQKEADNLARKFDVGTSGARALVSQVQSMGIVGRGSERQIGQLATQFIKLGAATHSSAAAVGQGVANLSRAFGNTNLDPRKITGISDSLVVLQAKFGGSAESILGFSQAIAPFARQAGLSEKATLGIAGAFQKLGDDSGSASTAVNKMLQDLNRAVRDGGPQMLKYASIVHMTTSAFEDLYKKDPAQALTKVTEALGRPGAQGQRDLEDLGLDGIRTQRALSALTQSGGLSSAISASINAPVGTTDKAAATAMHGYLDSIGKLQDASTLLAERLGAPVLTPLTAFSNALTWIVNKVGSITGNTAVQGALTVSGLAGGALALSAAASSKVGAAALARIGLRSGVVRSARLGMLERSTGLQGEELEAKLQQDIADNPGFAGGNARRRAEGRLKNVEYGRFLDTASADQLPAGAMTQMRIRGMFSGQANPMAEAAGPGFWQRMRNAGTNVGVGAIDMQHTWVTDNANKSMPQDTVGRRVADEELRTRGDRFRAAGRLFTGSGSEGEKDPLITRFKASGREFGGALKSMTEQAEGETSNLRRIARAGAQAGGGLLRTGSSTLWAGARTAGSFGASMLGGPLGIAAMAGVGGMALWNHYQGEQSKQQDAFNQRGNDSLTSGIDIYNQEIGRASQSTKTMADVMLQAADKLDKRFSGDMGDATHVSQADLDTSRGQKIKVNYSGRKDEVAGQIATMNRDGLDASQMNAIKLDLLRSGRSASDVQDILGSAQKMTTGKQGNLTGAQMDKTIAPLMRNPDSRARTNQLDYLSQRIGYDYDQTLSATNSQPYAESQRQKAIAQALSTAQRDALKRGNGTISAGDAKVLNEMGSRFGQQLGFDRKTSSNFFTATSYGPSGMPIGGGGRLGYTDFFDYLTKNSPDKNNKFRRAPNVGAPTPTGGSDYVSVTSGGGVDPRSFIARAFDVTSGTSAGNALRDVKPGSAKSINDAITALVKGAQNAKEGLGDFANQAKKAAYALPSDSPQAQVAMAAAGRAREYQQTYANSQGQRLGMDLLGNLSDAKLTSDDPNLAAQSDASRKAAQSDLDQVAQQMGQRLAIQREYQISSGRSAYDFNLNMAHSEDDFRRNRMRSQRDFNLSLKRQNEDAAKAMYDPYHRAGVEAVWDSRSLVQNLQDQQKRLAQQTKDLAQLRKMGLSGQAINQLSLADASHAQQVAILLANAQSDRSQIGSLNAATSSKYTAASTLNQDSGNVSLARAKQDRQQQIADSLADFKQGNDRARAAFNLNLSRQQDDMKRAQQSMTTNFGQIQAAMNKLINGQAVDFGSLYSNTLDDTIKTLKAKGMTLLQAYQAIKNMTLGGPTGADGGGTAGGAAASGGKGAGARDSDTATAVSGVRGTAAANMALGKKLAASRGWSTGAQWAALSRLWSNESGWNNMAQNPTSTAFGIAQFLDGTWKGMGLSKSSDPAAQINAGLAYIAGRYKTPERALATWNSRSPHWYGDGSIFSGPKVIGVGERGPEAVIPLNDRGVGVLTTAMARAMTQTQGKMIGTAMGRTHVHYDSSTHVMDQSVHIETVQVKSDNAGDLFRQLQDKQRTARLTSTPTRK
jgi:TP901 family phage tail tape measure protein